MLKMFLFYLCLPRLLLTAATMSEVMDPLELGRSTLNKNLIFLLRDRFMKRRYKEMRKKYYATA